MISRFSARIGNRSKRVARFNETLRICDVFKSRLEAVVRGLDRAIYHDDLSFASLEQTGLAEDSIYPICPMRRNTAQRQSAPNALFEF